MFHRSDTIMLRPIWPEDAPEIYEAINDEGVVRNLARAPWPYTLADARAFAAESSGVSADTARFLITLPDIAGAPIVGCVGLDPAGDDGHELGYWIARRYWGQGFATEAARAALDVARALGWSRVSAAHFLDNPASGRVLLKAGFASTGQTAERFSRARGCMARVACFAVDFGCGEEAEDPPLLDAA